MKYAEGSIIVWECFAASRPAQLVVINGKMKSQVYKVIEIQGSPWVKLMSLIHYYLIHNPFQPPHQGDHRIHKII